MKYWLHLETKRTWNHISVNIHEQVWSLPVSVFQPRSKHIIHRVNRSLIHLGPIKISRKYSVDCERGLLLETATGRVADTQEHSKGYQVKTINGSTRGVHRFIFEAYHGVQLPPQLQIDHIDGNKKNNRIRNLRLVTNTQNNQNKPNARSDSKSGIKGVHVDQRGRYVATFRKKRVGTFQTAREAKDAYNNAAEKFNLNHQGFYHVSTSSSVPSSIQPVQSSQIPEVIVISSSTITLSSDSD